MEFLFSSVIFLLYSTFQAKSIYGGDSGELVAAAFTGGIAHPPGYPLYMFLGNLASRIPWGTVAWRIGLLSSLPSALSLAILAKTITIVTKRRVLGILGMLTAAFLYPNFLYAIVPEVFGLYAFFSSILLYCIVRLIQTKEKKYIYWMSFVSGISLTHHHMIIILVVVIATVYWRLFKKTMHIHRLHLIPIFALFLFGLLPYLYAPIVSSGNPPFDWEHPASLDGFIRLVTRASYGTFRASYTTGQSVMDRILGVATVFHFTGEDFGTLGVVVIGIGIVAVLIAFKPYYPLLLGYAFALLAFFFYAGFPVETDFALGTLERFMIVLYQQFALLYAIGIGGVIRAILYLWKKYGFRHESMAVLSFAVIGIGFLLPIRLFRMNYPRLDTIRSDRTMEKVADDFLSSVPQGAILSLDTDTSINAVSYAYWVLGKRKDVVFMSFPLLQYPVYRDQLKDQFPQLVLPADDPTNEETYLARFIKSNAATIPVISGKLVSDIPEHWVPRGLVMQYFSSQKAIPDREKLLDENLALFDSFFDPSSAIKTGYHHLLLGDAIAIYDDRRLILAQALALSQRYVEAKDQVIRVIADFPSTSRYYTQFIKLLLSRDRCDDAKDILSRLSTKPMEGDQSLVLFYQTYKTCEPESNQFKKYEEVYQKYYSSRIQ